MVRRDRRRGRRRHRHRHRRFLGRVLYWYK